MYSVPGQQLPVLIAMSDDPATPAKETDPVSSEPAKKKQYEKPELVSHGTVGELTQSGGRRHRDGVATRKLS
jgi:hypothetical protein